MSRRCDRASGGCSVWTDRGVDQPTLLPAQGNANRSGRRHREKKQQARVIVERGSGSQTSEGGEDNG